MPTSDLALISKSLKALLTNNIERLAGSGAPQVKVAIGYPEDQNGATRTINLHLYHVTEDQFCRNLPGAVGTADVATAPMSLSLFYLMTAHHDAVNGKAEVEQTIMGQALKTIYCRQNFIWKCQQGSIGALGSKTYWLARQYCRAATFV